MIESGEIDPLKMVSHRVSMDELAEVYCKWIVPSFWRVLWCRDGLRPEERGVTYTKKYPESYIFLTPTRQVREEGRWYAEGIRGDEVLCTTGAWLPKFDDLHQVDQ